MSRTRLRGRCRLTKQSDRRIATGCDFRSGTKVGGSHAVKKRVFSIPTFRRATRSAHPVEKRLFEVMHGSDCSIENVFSAHSISRHSTKHTIAQHTNRQQLRCRLDCCCCSQRVSVAKASPLSPPASSAYRHPTAAPATLDEVQRENRNDEPDEAPNERWTRRKGATKT